MKQKKSTSHKSKKRERTSFEGRTPPTRLSRSDNLDTKDLVMGRNCVVEILKHTPERLLKVFVAERRDERDSQGRRGDLIGALTEHKVPVVQMGRQELSELVGSESHQGFVAVVSPRRILSLDALVKKAEEQDNLGVLALDGVLDPQNIGAVLRAAECFGVSAVMWSRNRSADLGPVIAKASVGASELLDLCPVSNLNRAIERLKSVGVWSVGAVVSPQAQSLDSFDAPEKWLLVMGSEGSGIQPLIQRGLDFSIYIPMRGKISSLNVSQATAVLLSRLSNSKVSGEEGR